MVSVSMFSLFYLFTSWSASSILRCKKLPALLFVCGNTWHGMWCGGPRTTVWSWVLYFHLAFALGRSQAMGSQSAFPPPAEPYCSSWPLYFCPVLQLPFSQSLLTWELLGFNVSFISSSKYFHYFSVSVWKSCNMELVNKCPYKQSDEKNRNSIHLVFKRTEGY